LSDILCWGIKTQRRVERERHKYGSQHQILFINSEMVWTSNLNNLLTHFTIKTTKFEQLIQIFVHITGVTIRRYMCNVIQSIRYA
jgi:hypothetical protein